MTNHVYDKTEKGREEIATRKEHLPPRLRTLLLLVDGKRSRQQLFEDFSSLGAGEAVFTLLLDEGFIQEISNSPQ
jgi:hypothetical protein